ncbi:MAG: hypothetical protein V7696_02345 [Halioglobus sp.]
MKTVTLLITVLTLSFAQYAMPQPGSQLEEVMTADEISAMGLKKLSPQEQQQLLEWVQNFRQTTPVVADSPAAVPAVTTTTATTDATSSAKAAAPSTTVATESSAITAEATATTEADNFGKAAEQADEMTSRIPGTFTGWTGNTKFVLENGQVWQQRYATRWTTELENPEVIVKRGLFGLHRMEIVDTSKSVPVKRIK